MRNSEEKRLQKVVTSVSALLFAVFSFLFVAVYQAPMLEAFYDSFSTGKLSFNPWVVGAVVSLLLTLLALWLNRLAKFRREWTAMAYLPSALILAFITDIDRTLYTGGGSMLGWVVVFLLGLTVYAFVSFLLRRILFEKIKDVTMTTNRVIWRNLILLVLIFMLVGTLSNGEENFKRETRAMSYFNKGDVEKALEVGYTSLDASHELTVMRAYMLAVVGEQGERLFEYPQYYASAALLPREERTSPLVPDSVYSLIGAKPVKGESAVDFLSRMAHSDSATNVVKEYYLSALLLDKCLPKFKDEVMNFYGETTADSLPKHFREALMLYADIDSNVSYTIDDNSMLRKFEAMRAEEAKHADTFVRGNYVRRYYGDTYWWYFLYGK